MSDIRFCSAEHRNFCLKSMMRCKSNDYYRRAFVCVVGIAPETRENIDQLFNFRTDSIKPEGLREGWQTSDTTKVCRIAFNLWNGYTEEGQERCYTPEGLFSSGFAPFFMEGVKQRFPEYFRELFPPKHYENER